MPASKFYLSGQVEDDGREPDLTVGWPTTGSDAGGVTLNGHPIDRSGINRLIRDLRRARDAMRATDE